jgi:hypothetical protein
MTDQVAIETGAAPEVAPVVPEATDAVEPVVPAEAPAVEETADAGDTAQQPQTKREVRAQLIEDRDRSRASREGSNQRQGVAGAVEEVSTEAAQAGDVGSDSGTVTDANGREHAKETGQFVAGQDGTGGELPSDGTAQAAPETGDRLVTVQFRDGHPVAEMGQAAITVANEAQAEALRALMNGTYTRHAELKDRDDRIAELRGKLAERNESIVRRESQEAAATKYQNLPAYQRHVEKYKEIHEMVDAESASAYWNSPHVQQELGTIEEQEYQSRMAPLRAEADAAEGQRWANDALSAAQSTIPSDIVALPEFQGVFNDTVMSFDAEFGRGMHAALDTPEKAHEHFAEKLRREVVNQPAIKAFLQGRIDARAAKEAASSASDSAARERATAATIQSERSTAVSEARQDAANTRTSNPPHPLGTLADANRGSDASGTVTGSDPDRPDTSNMTAYQLRQHEKAQARIDGRARANR